VIDRDRTAPDPAIDVGATIRNLAPRLLGHGVDYSDYLRTTAAIETWAGWLAAWVSAAEFHATLADRSLAAGDRVTAGEACLRAALYLHFAKFLWVEEPARYWEVTHRSVATHRRGMELLDPTFEHLEIAFDRDRIVANVRRPRGVGRAPFVILVPGVDSTKEEFPAWEEAFLRRGLATVSIDGPGQGEAGSVNPIRADFEVPIAAVLDHLEGRPDLGLAADRAGITGIGMGGYYASRAGAFERRIGAVGVVGGPYRFERMPPLVRRKFIFSAKAAGDDEAAELAAKFSLEGVTEQLTQPYLVIHGAHDAVMSPAEAERAARSALRGEFLLYPEGNTACQSVSHLFRPRLADWFRHHLGS